MFQAELDETNRHRALQATARDAHIVNRQWLIPAQQAAEILAGIEDAIEDAAAANNQGQNGLAADADENAMEDANAMYNRLQQALTEIQHQMVEL